MNSSLYRIDLTKMTGIGGFSPWPDTAMRYFRLGFVWLPVVFIAAFTAWALFSVEAGTTANSEPVPLAAPAITAQTLSLAADPAAAAPAEESQPAEENQPAEAAPVDGLKILSQSWRRGGLGSNALVTFTLRNTNDYAVRDIEISCAFTRRDGSHLTDRTRTIPDTIDMKSRRRFARMHIGFVNINADRAKCSPVNASRI